MSVIWQGFEYITMQVNGQRFIGPPVDVPEPSWEFELFVKRLPRYLFERDLVPFFSTAGFVYQIRLLMCFSGLNRGIAYVRYTNETDFRRALAMFNELPMGTRFLLYACKSLNMRKLVLLNIDESTADWAIRECVETVSGGLCVFIGFRNFEPTKKFAIIQFRCHYEAALARRKLMVVVPFFGDDCNLKWYNREGYKKQFILQHEASHQ